MCVITLIRRNYGFQNKTSRMFRDVLRARELTLHDVVCARDLTLHSNSARNVPLAMTMNNDGHGSMSMELRERVFGPRKLRYKATDIKSEHHDHIWTVYRCVELLR